MQHYVEKALFLVKVSRPGFYVTTLWFFLLPFGQRDMFGSWVFWLGCFYVCFPLGLLMYGWNDLMDIETDKHNPRKDSFLFGARLDPSQTPWLVKSMVWFQLPFLGLFVWIAGYKMLLWFGLMLFANVLYNGPGLGTKNYPGLDILSQVGYLLIFVLSSWLNNVPQLPLTTMAFAALFAMHSHLFGQLMDIEADRKAGRKTTANVIGIFPGKLLLVAILITESIILWQRDIIVAGFLMVSAAIFTIDALFVFRGRAYPSLVVKVFFISWNLIAVISMHWLWARGTLVGH